MKLAQRAICLTLLSALIWTSGGAAEAYAAFGETSFALNSHFSPQVVRRTSDPAFFTEQAMIERLISQRLAPGRQSVGYLFKHQLQKIQEWSVKPVHRSAPWLTRAVVASTALLVLTAIVDAHLTVRTGILTACGNFLAILKVKNTEHKIDLSKIDETLEPGIRELVNRGVYSFGFSFQIPVKRKIPRESQIPGFEEDKEVIVWEYQIGKVLLDKRDNALESAKKEIKYQLEQGLKRAAYTPEYLMISFHSRLGSVGTADETLQELEEAAQPGLAPPRGAPEDFELRFEPVIETANGFYNTLPPDYQMHIRLQTGELVLTQGAPDDVIFGKIKGTMTTGWRYVKADFQYQMNGDLSGFMGMHRNAPQEDIGNQVGRNRLTRWLGYDTPDRSWIAWIRYILAYPFTFWKPNGSVSPGDAPLQAMYFKLNYALRMPLAAIRYALFTHTVMPGEARHKNPPFELMQTTALVVAHAFRHWVKGKDDVVQGWITRPASPEEATALVHQKMLQAAQFAEYLKHLLTPSISDMVAQNAFLTDPLVADYVDNEKLQSIVQAFTPDELNTFLDEAAVAFWRNGAQYAALREAKTRVEGKGTQAADHNTVIEPNVRTVTANGQSLMGAIGKNNALIVSDRLGIMAADESLEVDQMLKINSSGNESSDWEVTSKGVRVALYRGVSNTPISTEDVQRKRLSPIKDPENAEPTLKDLPPLAGMEAGVRRSAVQLARINHTWENVRRGLKGARNLRQITELTRVRAQLRIYKVLMTQMFRRGLPVQDMDSWAWTKADHLSRLVWSEDLVGPQILEAVDAAVAELLRTQPAPTSTKYVDLTAILPVYDAVYVANGKTFLAMQKSALSLERSLGLHILVIDGGDLLKIVNKYSRRDRATGKPKLDPEGLLRELKVNRHVPWVLASDSGAETYEINILSAVAKVVTEEPFGISGTSRNHLVDQFGKNRVMATENFGSKDQDSTAAFLSTMQTLQEADLWATENLSRRFETGGREWGENPFFKTEFTHDEVAQLLIPTNNQLMKDLPERILGYTANGIALDTKPRPGNDAANIRLAGLWNAERDLEGARFWLLTKTYVALTVGLSLLHFAPVGHLLLPHLLHPSTLTTILMDLTDVSIYLGLGLSALLIKRWIFLKLGWSNTKVWEGWGLPTTLLVSSDEWLAEALADQGWVGEGLAYIQLKSTYLSAKLSKVNDKYRAAANRNTNAIIFRPGSDHEAFEFDDQSADQAGRHLKTQVSMPIPYGFRWLAKFLRIRPVAPKVVHAGLHQPPAPDDNWGLMARTVDETIGKLPLAVPPGMKFSDLPYHVAEYYLEQNIAQALYMQGVRRQATRADKRAKGVLGLFFKYRPGVYWGGYAVKSTQAPSPGSKSLTAAERAAREMPLRMVDIVDHTAPTPRLQDNPAIHPGASEWHAWPQSAQWLEGGTEEHAAFELPWRPITTAKIEDSVVVAEESPRRVHTAPQRAQAAAAPTTARGVIRPDELNAILQSVEPRSDDPTESTNTTLLMKQQGVRSLSTLKWGPVVVKPDGQWDLKAEGQIPPTAGPLLEKLFNQVLQSAGLKKPFIFYVQQVRRRAAESKAAPEQARAAGTITLDADLMEDVLNGEAFALETALLEMVEEGAHLSEAPSSDRFEMEVRMLWKKVQAFGALPSDEQRQGVIQYLRSHRLYDPSDLGLADLFEIVTTVNVNLHERNAYRILEPHLKGYVAKAFEYEGTPRNEPTPPAVQPPQDPTPALPPFVESQAPRIVLAPEPPLVMSEGHEQDAQGRIDTRARREGTSLPSLSLRPVVTALTGVAAVFLGVPIPSLIILAVTARLIAFVQPARWVSFVRPSRLASLRQYIPDPESLNWRQRFITAVVASAIMIGGIQPSIQQIKRRLLSSEAVNAESAPINLRRPAPLASTVRSPILPPVRPQSMTPASPLQAETPSVVTVQLPRLVRSVRPRTVKPAPVAPRTPITPKTLPKKTEPEVAKPPVQRPPSNSPLGPMLDELKKKPIQDKTDRPLGQTILGVFLAAGAVLGAATSAGAATLNEAPVAAALNTGLQTAAIQSKHLVIAGDAVDRIAAQALTTRQAIIDLNPFLQDRIHVVGDAVHQILDIRIFPGEHIATTLPSHALTTGLMQAPDVHASLGSVLAPATDAGLWQHVLQTTSHEILPILMMALMGAVVLYFISQRRSVGSVLRNAVVSIMAVMQLTAPSMALSGTPAQRAASHPPVASNRVKPSRPATRVTRPARMLPIVGPPLPTMLDSKAIPPSVELTVPDNRSIDEATFAEARDDVSDAAAEQAFDWNAFGTLEKDPKVAVKRLQAEMAKPPEAPNAVAQQAVRLFLFTHAISQLPQGDFEKALGTYKPKSALRWAFVWPIEFGKGFGSLKSEGKARPLKELAALNGEEIYLKALREQTAWEAAYGAAKRWKDAQPESPEAAAAFAQTSQRFETVRATVKGINELIDAKLAEGSVLLPYQAQLRSARSTPRVSLGNLEGRKKYKRAEWTAQSHGPVPAILAANVPTSEASASEARIEILLGEKNFWEQERTRHSRLFNTAPLSSEADRSVGQSIIDREEAAMRQADFDAARAAAESGLDLTDLTPWSPDQPVIVHEIAGKPKTFDKQKDAMKAFGAALSTLRGKEFEVASGLADQAELAAPVAALQPALAGWTDSIAEAKEQSQSLRKNAGKENPVFPVNLPALEVPLVTSPTGPDVEKRRVSRIISRDLTDGTESAPLLSEFMQSYQLTDRDALRMESLAKLIAGYPEGNTPAEKGKILVFKMKLAALAVQENAKLNKQPVPSLPKAMAEALDNCNKPNAWFLVLIQGAARVDQMIGSEASTIWANHFPEGEAMPALVRLVAQEYKPATGFKSIAEQVRIAVSVLEIADHTGFFPNATGEWQHDLVEWALKVGKLKRGPGVAEGLQNYLKKQRTSSSARPSATQIERRDAFVKLLEDALLSLTPGPRVRKVSSGTTLHAFFAVGSFGTASLGLPPGVVAGFAFVGLISLYFAARSLWRSHVSVPDHGLSTAA